MGLLFSKLWSLFGNEGMFDFIFIMSLIRWNHYIVLAIGNVLHVAYRYLEDIYYSRHISRRYIT